MSESRYRIKRRVGAGGVGEILLAEDLELGRDVALKFLSSQTASDPQVHARFREEARVCASLEHPHIVRMFDIGEYQGRMFLSFEFIPGEDLAEVVRKSGPLSLDRVRYLAGQILDGLAYAHDSGVVHRDIKPSNILISKERDAAVIADFGMALMERGREFETLAGMILGTPEYMAPEVIRGGVSTVQSDLYALGCTLYFSLAGRVPYLGDRDIDTLGLHLSPKGPTPLPALRPEVPRHLASWVDRALEKLPEHRWSDARAMRDGMGMDRPRTTPGLEEQTRPYDRSRDLYQLRRSKGPDRNLTRSTSALVPSKAGSGAGTLPAPASRLSTLSRLASLVPARLHLLGPILLILVAVVLGAFRLVIRQVGSPPVVMSDVLQVEKIAEIEGDLIRLARGATLKGIEEILSAGPRLPGYRSRSFNDHDDVYDEDQEFFDGVRSLVRGDVGLEKILSELDRLEAYFTSDAPPSEKWVLYQALRPVHLIDLLLQSQRVGSLFRFQDITRGLIRREYLLDPGPRASDEIAVTSGPTCWFTRDYSSFLEIQAWNAVFPHTDGILRSRGAPISMEVRRPRVDDYDWIRTYPRVIESWSEQTAYLRIHALVTYYGPAYYWTLRFKGAGAESMFLRLTHSGEPEWYQAMNGQRGVRYEKASDGRFTRVPGTKPEADRTWGEARITVPRSILPEPPIDLVVRMDHLPAIKLDDLGKIQRLSYIQDFTLQPLAHED